MSATWWGFHKWGCPNSWMVDNGKSNLSMDDDWGYFYFRKPPKRSTCHVEEKPLYGNFHDVTCFLCGKKGKEGVFLLPKSGSWSSSHCFGSSAYAAVPAHQVGAKYGRAVSAVSACKNESLQLESFSRMIYDLVGGLEHFLFSTIYGIILPIDFHIFQDG